MQETKGQERLNKHWWVRLLDNKRLWRSGLSTLLLLLGSMIFIDLPTSSTALYDAPTIAVQRVTAATPTYQILQLVSPLPTPINKTEPVAKPAVPPVAMTDDLLFVNKQGLLRWRPRRQQVELILSAPITPTLSDNDEWRDLRYTVSKDQQKVLIVYGHGRAGQPYAADLLLYDTAQATITPLLTSRNYLFSFAISPDHQWAAYIVWDVEPPSRYSWWQRLLKTHPCACGEPPAIGTVYVVRLQPPYQPQKLRVCGPTPTGQGECNGLLGWLFNNHQLVWQDGAGYWNANLEQNQTTLLLQNSESAIALNPSAKALYHQRYLISWLYKQWKVSYGILDTHTWRLLALPQPTGYAVHGTPLLWLTDNRLLWAKPAAGDATQSPTLELWSLQPGKADFLTLQQSLQIPTKANLYPLAATQLPDGRLWLALVNADRTIGGQSGLYELNLTAGVLQKKQDFPPFSLINPHQSIDYFGQLFWSPDGTGAIYLRPLPDSLGWHSYFIPTHSAPAQMLGTWLGKMPEQLTWLKVN